MNTFFNYSAFHSYNLFDINLPDFRIKVLEIYRSLDYGWMYKIDTDQGIFVLSGCEERFTEEEFCKLKITVFKSHPHYYERERYVATFFTK